MSGPRLRAADGYLLVDEWESYASAGFVRTPGKHLPEVAVVVVVTGRINKSADRATVGFMLPPDEAIGLARGIYHSATNLGGRPVPIDIELPDVEG